MGSLAACQSDGKVKIKSLSVCNKTDVVLSVDIRFKKQAPMLIDHLLTEFLPDPDNELRQYIDYIVSLKKGGDEEILVDRSRCLNIISTHNWQSWKTSCLRIRPNLP